MEHACRESLTGLDLAQGMHAALLLERYLRIPVKARDHEKAREGLLEAAGRSCENSLALYEQAWRHWQKRIKGSREKVRIAGRLALGLGAESPLEAGVRLHHTYGTPILPASALKGLAAHYCDQVWGEREEEFRRTVEEESGGERVRRSGKYFQALFGTTEDSGHLLFHDAWILPASLGKSLEPDVMTVHHESYYQEKGPPSDFDDPNPINFLSIRGEFEVVVQCDVPGEEGERWERLALHLLREAMEEWGLGAKTSAGYGRIRRVVEETDAGQETLEPEELKVGQCVSCVVMEEKTRKGGWRFRIKNSHISGVLHPQSPVPAGLAAGKELELEIASTGSFQFRWAGKES